MANRELSDVVIVGAGFAGSLLALLLARRGLQVTLVERDRHPRFAIGESATPLADLALRRIANDYDLPWLASLSSYGRWQSAFPHVMRGCKRGFSYFAHEFGRPFDGDALHSTELLAAASRDDFAADTHWLRQDVDALFVEQARIAGVEYFDMTDVQRVEGPTAGRDGESSWRITARRSGDPIEFHGAFLVVASGPMTVNAEWTAALSSRASKINTDQGETAGPNEHRGQLASPRGGWRTNTRTLFAHFANVTPWRDVLALRAIPLGDHPFDCDRSAQHHVFDGGWMWQLRFDDGVTSAGWMIDNRRHPFDPSISPAQEWQGWLDQFPSIADQFARARLVRPNDGIRRVPRVQRAPNPLAGIGWARLPGAAGFADALHSTGIAHSLLAVEELAKRIVESHRSATSSIDAESDSPLDQYAASVAAELDLIDRLVSLAYRCSGDFRRFAAVVMAYFAAATTCEMGQSATVEKRRVAAKGTTGASTPAVNSTPSTDGATATQRTAAFLLADHPAFLAAIAALERAADETAQSRQTVDSFVDVCRRELAPFNHVGLFGATPPNMFRYTAAR